MKGATAVGKWLPPSFGQCASTHTHTSVRQFLVTYFSLLKLRFAVEKTPFRVCSTSKEGNNGTFVTTNRRIALLHCCDQQKKNHDKNVSRYFFILRITVVNIKSEC